MTSVPVRGISIKGGKIKRITKGSQIMRKAKHAKADRLERKWIKAGTKP